MKYTEEELNTAIETAKDIQKRDGLISSSVFLDELTNRTGKPKDYFNPLELLIYYKRTTTAIKRNNRKFSEHEKKIILQTAERIAKKRHTKLVTANTIRNNLCSTDYRTYQNITTAPELIINKVLIESGYRVKLDKKTLEKRQEYRRIYYQKNKEKLQEYKRNHREEQNAYQRKSYRKHREYKRDYNRNYRERNPEYIKEYYQTHKEQYRESRRRYYQNPDNVKRHRESCRRYYQRKKQAKYENHNN